MRPTVEDLQAIWLFTYSRVSLLQAAEFFAELDVVEPESVQGRALIEATLIAYARPFTACFLPPNQKKVNGPLKDVSPPEHLAEVHKQMRIVRDTVIGHKDGTARQNIVRVEIHPPKVSLNGAMVGGVLPPLKRSLGELCTYFVKHCESNLSRLNKTYRAEFMKHPPGEYGLVISELPAAWLIPFRTKHGADFRESPTAKPWKEAQ